jgi:hypothetical protein
MHASDKGLLAAACCLYRGLFFTTLYFKSNEGKVSTGFPVYMTRKTQEWFRGWGCPHSSDTAAFPDLSAAPGGAGSGAGAATPARPPAPSALDDEEGADLITAGAGDDQVPLPTLNLETLPSFIFPYPKLCDLP